MKPVRFLGDSLKRLREFPAGVSHDVGYQLDKVQRGGQPDDFKPMPTIGNGVEEIRVRDDSGAYRVIYTARQADMIYVLHAFEKKTQTTSKRDIDLARRATPNCPEVCHDCTGNLQQCVGRHLRHPGAGRQPARAC